MGEVEVFRDLIRRVRAGDEQANTELVRRYEAVIRVAVHVRLTDPGLRRLTESVDIVNSVLFSFFKRVTSGQFELDSPAQLLKLLKTMARNKLVNYANRQKAAMRDYRRVARGLSMEEQCIDNSPDPSQVLADREELQLILDRLTPEEQVLVELRLLGLSWQEVAAKVGGESGSVRMRHDRALARVRRELGLVKPE